MGSIFTKDPTGVQFLCARPPPSFQHLVENLDVPDPALPISLSRFKQQLIHHLLTTSQEVAIYQSEHLHPKKPPAVQEAFQVGDLVWLEDKTQTSKLQSKKLANIWQGPFLILEIFSNRNVKILYPSITQPRQELRVSFDRIRRYTCPIYMPWLQSGHPFKFPKFILAKRIRNGESSYKVQWLSTTQIPDTWEPADKLPPQLIFNYEQQLKVKSFPPTQPRLPLQS